MPATALAAPRREISVKALCMREVSSAEQLNCTSPLPSWAGRLMDTVKGWARLLTCELPVSSTFCLQIGKVRMHQESRIIAPYTRLCHPCFQGFKHLFLGYMKYAQVCKAGEMQEDDQQKEPEVKQAVRGVGFSSAKRTLKKTYKPSGLTPL